MNYLEKLVQSSASNSSIVCMGIDPVLEKIPIQQGDAEEKITCFYSEILDSSPKVSALKPNYAFFAQYGFEGLRALKTLISKYSNSYPIILDAKRGDIGKTAQAYAREIYSFWGADATTLSPYMGADSITPFMSYKDKFSYILCRTSNESAEQFQGLKSRAKKSPGQPSKSLPLYLNVAKEMQRLDSGQNLLGLVVSATAPKELSKLCKALQEPKLPLLIPGVGSQGGDLKKAVKTLKKAYGEGIRSCLINASSSINFAFEKEGTQDYVGAANKEISRMNKEIRI